MYVTVFFPGVGEVGVPGRLGTGTIGALGPPNWP